MNEKDSKKTMGFYNMSDFLRGFLCIFCAFSMAAGMIAMPMTCFAFCAK